MAGTARSLIHRKLDAVVSTAVAVPKFLGRTLHEAGVPRLVAQGLQDAANALPTKGSGPLDPKATVTAALDLAGLLNSQRAEAAAAAAAAAPQAAQSAEHAQRWLGQAAQSALGSGAQSGIEAANDVFSALGVQILIVHTQSPSARARVRLDELRSTGDGSGGQGSKLTPREFVQFMREARDNGNVCCSLEDYIGRMVREGRLQPISVLSSRFQTKLCVDIARLIVFAFQRSFLSLDQAQIWGHTLHVKAHAIRGSRFGAEGAPRPKSSVGEAQLGVLVDRMLESQAVRMAYVSQPFERRLYLNCLMVVFQLVEDLLSGDGEAITFMGHKMLFKLEPVTVRVLKEILEVYPVMHCQVNDAVIEELVTELLNDAETNIPWLPDAVESRVYCAVMRLLVRIIEHVVSRLRLNILGRDVSFSLLSHMDKRVRHERAAIAAAAAQAEAQLYYEEEDPLRTVSTTELEERLKDLDQQRRTLEAIQQLRGADFDLMKEVPLVDDPGHAAAGAKRAKADAAQESAEGAADLTGYGEEDSHEFQRLAHTLKLGRSLSVKIEVDADIEVPFSMIADVESYPLWMPWCTSGHVVENEDAAAFRSGASADFDGKVGFGFETGTFLGTVGDTVSYRVSARPPAALALDEAAGGGQTRLARVTADAVNGFTYGKRLVYDWHFREDEEGRTKVELDMLFQAHSVLYMPVWDSMQHMVVNNMLSAFVQRAEELQQQRTAADIQRLREQVESDNDMPIATDATDGPSAPRSGASA